jgi:hypothetical protein
MVRPCFRSRSLLTLSLLSVPALCIVGACGNQASTAPPGGNGGNSFPDTGISPVIHHEAGVPKPKDGGHDSTKLDALSPEGGGLKDGAGKDGATDGAKASIDDSGTGTPCTKPSE